MISIDDGQKAWAPPELTLDSPELSDVQGALDRAELRVTDDDLVTHDTHLEQRAGDNEHTSRAICQFPGAHKLWSRCITPMGFHHRRLLS
jgi:hypothetical protein